MSPEWIQNLRSVIRGLWEAARAPHHRHFRRFLPSRGRMCELRKAEGETGRAGQPWAKDAIAIPVSRLMSGQATGKTSVPWMVPMTWRHLACTPERKSSR